MKKELVDFLTSTLENLEKYRNSLVEQHKKDLEMIEQEKAKREEALKKMEQQIEQLKQFIIYVRKGK